MVKREDGGGEGSPPTDSSDDIRRLEWEIAHLSGQIDSMTELREVDRSHREDQMRFLERQIEANGKQIKELGDYIRETAALVRSHDSRFDAHEQAMAEIRENLRVASESA